MGARFYLWEAPAGRGVSACGCCGGVLPIRSLLMQGRNRQWPTGELPNTAGRLSMMKLSRDALPCLPRRPGSATRKKRRPPTDASLPQTEAASQRPRHSVLEHCLPPPCGQPELPPPPRFPRALRLRHRWGRQRPHRGQGRRRLRPRASRRQHRRPLSSRPSGPSPHRPRLLLLTRSHRHRPTVRRPLLGRIRPRPTAQSLLPRRQLWPLTDRHRPHSALWRHLTPQGHACLW